MIREHIDLDPRPGTPESCHGAFLPPVVRPVRLAVGQVAGVVAGAVVAAVAVESWVREVGADLLGCGPEVVEGVLLVGEHVAGGD